MVQSVLGSLILGYRPLWNRARKLAAIQLYVHSEASALVDTAHLLEVRELRHLHAIEPDLPAQAPGAQRGVLPVVFDKADVVFLEVKTQGLKRPEVQLQDVGWRRFEHHLILVIVLEAVGVLAIASIFGTTAGLHIRGLPGLWAQGTQEGGGVTGTGPDFHVIGLQQRTALCVPVALESKNQLLEGQHGQALVAKGNSNG